MHNGDLLIISGHEISELLAGHESDLMRIVRRAYEIHGEGKSYLPHSVFLRLPDKRNRIIGLPAYLRSTILFKYHQTEGALAEAQALFDADPTDSIARNAFNIPDIG